MEEELVGIMGGGGCCQVEAKTVKINHGVVCHCCCDEGPGEVTKAVAGVEAGGAEGTIYFI